MTNQAAAPTAFLQALVASMSAAIQKYTKQNIELANWTEYYDGNEQPNLVLRQWPVWSGVTTLASSMNGLTLPQATIDCAGTSGFNPNGGTIAVQITGQTFTPVTYTGVTATSFTGCSGGTGTLNSSTSTNRISSPCVWVDFNGYGGQGPGSNGRGPFADGTIQPQGTSYQVWLDTFDLATSFPTSKRGLLTRTGGYGGPGWPGQFQGGGWGMGQGKLASGRLPCWSRGQQNIKVAYSAGYSEVPADITYAASMLVAWAVRNMPNGAELSSESLGAYSYSVLQNSLEIPALGTVARTLAQYREVSW